LLAEGAALQQDSEEWEGSRQGGCYVLLLRAARGGRQVMIGRLGELLIRRGWYLYVGSAFGPGGVAARVAHHLRHAARPRWHLDYLRPHLRVEGLWYSHGPRDLALEHRWAARLAAVEGAEIPLARFGASDCRCASHLFRFSRCPDPRWLRGEEGCSLGWHRFVPTGLGRCQA